MPTIDIVYVNAGGGHRATAEALRAILAMQRPGWRVRLVQLFEALDPQHRFQRIFRFRPETFYNVRLRHGLTLGLRQELRLLQAWIRLMHPSLVSSMAEHWGAEAPDLLVSVVPNFNGVLQDALHRVRPGAPFLTVMSDLADLPPHFWMERYRGQHVACGSDRAVAQAKAMGFPNACIHALSGMVLHPSFHLRAPQDRAAQRQSLGLDPLRPTGIVMFGGHGARAMVSIAKQLDDTQLIMVCGHNETLARQIRALPARAPRLVLGFSNEVARLMDLADFFIGKPGPGSISEALACGLPVIVTSNAWTMPQERFNTQWIQQQGVGVVLGSFKAIRSGVDEVLRRLPALRAAVARLDNRAVFEVPDVLSSLLQGAAAPPRQLPSMAMAA